MAPRMEEAQKGIVARGAAGSHAPSSFVVCMCACEHVCMCPCLYVHSYVSKYRHGCIPRSMCDEKLLTVRVAMHPSVVQRRPTLKVISVDVPPGADQERDASPISS